MICNVGKMERVIRIALATVFILVGTLSTLPPWGSGIAYVLAAVALLTGLAGFCPLWKLFGINTCSKKTI